MKQALVIVNPHAGRGRARRVWPEVSAALTSIPNVDVVHTTGPRHARALAGEAAATGCERVVVVGGDGTVSEVAGGLIDTAVALAIVPVGTGNDIGQQLRVPSQPAAALRLGLRGENIRSIDAAWVKTQQQRVGFVNLAGCGFDAEVLRRTPRWGRGSVPYLAGVLRTLWAVGPRPIRLELDDTVIECRAIGVAVGNGWRYGGGIRVLPRAVVDDGILDVCLMGDVSPWRLLSLLPRIYAGTHTPHPAVRMFRCRRLKVRALAGDAIGCQADGELVGTLPATFEVAHRALRVVCGPA